jgi:hypothetical protein
VVESCSCARRRPRLALNLGVLDGDHFVVNGQKVWIQRTTIIAERVLGLPRG